MSQRLNIILVCILMLLLCTSYSLADDTSMGRTPDGVYPINNDDIEMVDELVNIYLEEGKAECIFTFKNTGEDNTVLMGFPATLNKDYVEHSPGEAEDSIITDFKAFDGEKELLVKLEKEVKVNLDEYNSNRRKWYDKWYTFEVNFKAGETKTIKNIYRFKSAVSSVGSGLIQTGYVLDTGAAWKGNIGHAKVVFHLNDIIFTRIEGFYPLDMTVLRLKEDKLIFEKSDFEPDFNLELAYWMDPGNLDENESFYQHLNHVRHMRKNRFFQLVEASNRDKDRYFKEAAVKGNSIEILYLLNKLNRTMYDSASPEIGELLVNNDKALNISVIDLTGDLKAVKYEIYSLENSKEILYEKEQKIEKNNAKGFGVKNRFSPRTYKEKASIKLKISAIDYKNNKMEYETDIYFNGSNDEGEKPSKETEENSDESIKKHGDIKEVEGNESTKYILYGVIVLLITICIIQYIRIQKLKQ